MSLEAVPYDYERFPGRLSLWVNQIILGIVWAYYKKLTFFLDFLVTLLSLLIIRGYFDRPIVRLSFLNSELM